MAAKLLVCAATLPELTTFWRTGEETALNDDQFWTDQGSRLVYALTGVGVPCTLLRLPLLLQSVQPERVLNIGIAGAYPNSGMAIGDIAMADAESFGDIGFELPDAVGFQPVHEAPFGRFYRTLPMEQDARFQSMTTGYAFHMTGGCTVNTCTGTFDTGVRREKQFGAGMESMEGAAVALAGEAACIPVCEVRAISNIAAKRDMRPENIRLALERLRDHLQKCREREGI